MSICLMSWIRMLVVAMRRKRGNCTTQHCQMGLIYSDRGLGYLYRWGNTGLAFLDNHCGGRNILIESLEPDVPMDM